MARVFLAVTAISASAAEPPVSFDAVRDHATALLDKLPNYTCTQTVERHSMGGHCRDCQYRDRVRLEVAVVNNREVYAWPGAGRLGEREVDDLYGGGTVGNGDFGGFVSSIFFNRSTAFSYLGEEAIAGRPSLRFDYQTPRSRSSYTVSAGSKSAVVGYQGSFWIDPKSLDLVRLEVRAQDIPAALGVSFAGTRIDYARVRIGGADFLLPVRSELRMETPDGLVSRNVSSYSGCHQYVGESTIRFDAGPEPGQAGAAVEAAASAFPAGVKVQMELAAPIDLATAAQGDPVEAIVSKDVKHGPGALAPKGALVKGRITHLRMHDYGRAVTLLALEFHSIEAGGAPMRFDAALDSASSYFGNVRMAQAAGLRYKGLLVVPKSIDRLPARFRMTWKSLPAAN